MTTSLHSKYQCIMDQKLHMQQRAWVDINAAIWKVRWRDIRNLAPSINAHLLKEKPCQISSRSNFKRQNHRPLSQNIKNNSNRMHSQIRSVTDLKSAFKLLPTNACENCQKSNKYTCGSTKTCHWLGHFQAHDVLKLRLQKMYQWRVSFRTHFFSEL